MKDVRPGDIIFGYVKGELTSISRARDIARDHPRPSAWPKAGDSWGEDGRIVHLDQEMLTTKIKLESLRDSGAILPSAGPFNYKANVNVGYLFALGEREGGLLWNFLQPFRGSIPQVSRNRITSDDTPDVTNGYFTGRLDPTRSVKGRGEQRQLRLHLLGKAEEIICDLCGLELPRELIRAAHIVRRADLTDAERRQFDRIAFRACTLGCDALFEAGFIAVRNGNVIAGRPANNVHTESAVAAMVGNKCTGYSSDRAPLFARHRKSSGASP